MNRRTLIGSLILVPAGLAAASTILAHDESTPSDMPMASPMAGMADTGTGAAYLTITNTSESDDRLIAAASAIAQLVQIHDMVVENDVMSMVHLEEGLPIPSGETVVLEPMSLHLMLISLYESILPGMTFDITLTFEQAGDVTVTAQVATEIPEESDTFSVGDLDLTGIWSRPAPKLSAGTEGTPNATPAH